jgi:hypothetical protein
VLNKFLNFIVKKQFNDMNSFMKHPLMFQETIFRYLIRVGKNTVFGKYFGFSSLKNFYNFKNKIPLFTYENLYPYIESTLKGNKNIL